MNAIHDKRGLLDVPQVREALGAEAVPLAERRHLGLRYFRSGNRFAILLALHEPFDEGGACSLAGLCWCEENLLQHLVAFERRVGEVLCKHGLFQMHDVFAATRRGADEDHAPEDRGAVLHHLLRDHATEREAEHVADLEPEPVEERESVRRHAGDGFGHDAAGATHAGAFKQNDFASRRERIGDGGVPIVEGSSEMLQAQQRKAGTCAEAPIGVSLAFNGNELRRCGDVACFGRHAHCPR